MVVIENADTYKGDVSDEKITLDLKCTPADHLKESSVSTTKNHGGHRQIEDQFLLDKQQVNIPTRFKSNNLIDDINMSTKQTKDVEDPKSITVNYSPPDGGFRAWMILLGSFIINGVLFSIINSYSVIQLQLKERLSLAGESNPETKAALVGSLTIGTTFLLSPIAGILTDKIGIQITTFLGGLLASGGMILSSIYCTNVIILCLTYGVIYGAGASLAYTPSLAILGHYFKRHLGLANGIVAAGSSVFTMIMPHVTRALLDRFDMVGALRSFAILTSIIMLCAFLFKPTLTESDKSPSKLSSYKQNSIKKPVKKVKWYALINLSIWKKRRYVVWASAIPISLFGYFVLYVHIGSFIKENFGKDYNVGIPVTCIGITSGIGRLVFGYIADLPKVNRILLQQISFISIGVLMIVLPFTPPYWAILIIIALLFGLFDGCFISLLGPIAFDFCGKAGATQAIGFLLGICSIPLTIGPPVAGLIIERTGSYTLAFVLAGIPAIVGALVMFVIRHVKEKPTDLYASDKLNNDGSINSDACNDESKELEILSGFKETASLSS
ncbi:monocarboxylate transporter 10 isoform X2 [Chelonus insularis]|uniref:monocarboxylate transporter 10 isoform X2 n=1 Tax=Chelonus insularis TaxID=460826 RepID=UPI0015883BD6|nr:monocarboxylate transporter 10 isoform X2 [Chelonus insularis]